MIINFLEFPESWNGSNRIEAKRSMKYRSEITSMLDEFRFID